jgi:hypothetical protein
MTATDEAFFPGLYSGEVGSLIGLTTNCLQLDGFGEELISGLGTGSDTDWILEPTARLERQNVDFAVPGPLIDEEVELAGGIAQAGTAVDRVIRYLRIRDAADQWSDDTELDHRGQVFLELPETGSDPRPASPMQPFFIPGVERAATVRALALIANAGNACDLSGDGKQIQALVALVQGVIASVAAAVEAAHTVERDHDGYRHLERGQPLGFFSAGGGRTPIDPRVAKARAAAESAMRQGVAAELAFIGIPQLESLVGKWQARLVREL